ncbi:MAG TPA: cysteine peptidase family C39 domain-containing protein [Bryobacteraceae bacterium]|nr:cysteine peptidase family C39 domain-containing protein [Bryobacteraceae bacterium]
MKRFFAPEVVQTSNLDCGPASLKCLLEGFGIPVSYGRLREACQTALDGTSIDTMELVAQQLGLEAEQIMLPVDHVALPQANAVPSIVVIKLASGLTHFVVLWKKHGNLLQLMDPATGRRWTSASQFANELFEHTIGVAASDWREFAASTEFQSALQARLVALGISANAGNRLRKEACDQTGWYALASLDAAVRLTNSLLVSGAIRRGSDAERFVTQFVNSADLIPGRYWTVREGVEQDGVAQVLMRGAVLVRAKGRRAVQNGESAPPEIAAVVQQKPLSPGRELLRLLSQSGGASLGTVVLALAAAAGGTVIEALLFRSLFDISGELALTGQRMAAIGALLLFGLALLLIEIPVFVNVARAGRQLENRLRVAFLSKIPRLADRYFQSRLTSDMAERGHATHRLRHLPDLLRQLLRGIFELLATAAGIIWLDASAAPFVLVAVAAALVPAFGIQTLLAERDLRVRSHAAGLTRFYLDAMLGMIAIRAHGAEQNVRREHETMLRQWANAALRLQRAVVCTEGIQLAAMFGLVAMLLLARPLASADIGRTLLLVYWALNLPSLGQDVAALTRQYPYYRNLTLRLMEPLGAPEEEDGSTHEQKLVPMASAPAIEFQDVGAEVSGHRILQQISVRIEPGMHVAVVGPSGAGKSSFISILLGWLKPSAGHVLIDSKPLDCGWLRRSTAWLDPAVQLWNRSLLSNLTYGSESAGSEVGQAVDTALLRQVLETLPDGLQTKLGEGGALVSGGEGQRVRLARALLRTNTQLVLLDEPFRGLDREKRRELLSRARDFWRGRTMICITHDIAETQAFDRVLVMERGSVVEDGNPRELAMNDSRYGQLLAAERTMRSAAWGASLWRRVRIHSGQALESLPAPEQDVRASEVA